MAQPRARAAQARMRTRRWALSCSCPSGRRLDRSIGGGRRRRRPPHGGAGKRRAPSRARCLGDGAEQGGERLRLGLVAGVHLDVGLGVERRAAFQDGIEVVHGLRPVGHWPQVALGEHAAHVLIGRGAEPDDEAGARAADRRSAGSVTRLPPVAITTRSKRATMVSRHCRSSERNMAWPCTAKISDSSMPLARSISRSSSTNGTASAWAASWPSVVLPAPRRPTSAMRPWRRGARLAEPLRDEPPRLGQLRRRQALQLVQGEREIHGALRRVAHQRGGLDAQRLGDLAQHQQGGIAGAPLQLGQVALGHTGCARERLARHAAAGRPAAPARPRA